jgi:CheY-like chemotaxis protein
MMAPIDACSDASTISRIDHQPDVDVVSLDSHMPSMA